jgi:lipoteichoic acid synthase
MGMGIKMKNSIKQFISDNLIIIIFFLLILSKSLYYAHLISPYSNNMGLHLAILASILPVMAFAYLFKKNMGTFLYIFNLLFSILLVIDTIYYKYFNDIISIGAISNAVLLGDVSSSVIKLISLTDFVFLLDVIILTPLIIWRKRKSVQSYNLKIRIWIFAILIFTGVSIDTYSIYKLHLEQPLIITTMSNKLFVADSLGIINYHLLDGYNFISNAVKSKNISKDRINEISLYLENNQNKNLNQFTGIGSGKNLIVIQVEALQQFAINAKINGQEVTPNLNRWLKKSLYFDNYFYQVAAGNTSDAEFMTNNSLYPAESGAAYYKYVGDKLNSLPTGLKDIGYYTAALHAYIEGFWNRNAMYKTEGFNDFFGQHSFNIDEKVGLGLSDKSFLNQSVDMLKSFSEPYYSFIVTLSSHFPYDDVSGYGNFNVGEYNGTLLGDYLKAIHYTDAQLGNFLDKLNSEGILSNSVLVLYGDHNAIPKSNIDELYKFENIKNPTDLNWYQLQKVPMMIHFPEDNNKGVNHTYSAQMDLLPTISNMFNLKTKYTLGKDIMNTNLHNVIFRNGSFTDGKIFYVSWSDTYYNITTGNKITKTPNLVSKKEDVLKDLSYSDDILNHNLIKKIDSSK